MYNSTRQFTHKCQLALICCTLCCLLLTVFGCAPISSDLQSARLVDKGKCELTTSYGLVKYWQGSVYGGPFLGNSKPIEEDVQRQLGFQLAIGTSDRHNVRFRYVHVDGAPYDVLDQTIDVDAEVVSLGLKYGLLKDYVALYFPVGFAFGDEIDESKTWSFHPTVLIRLPLSRYLEINPSYKAMIPISRDDDVLYALNIGLGLSTNLEKWAIRPETGFLFNPGEDGHYGHFSMGATWYP